METTFARLDKNGILSILNLPKFFIETWNDTHSHPDTYTYDDNQIWNDTDDGILFLDYLFEQHTNNPVDRFFMQNNLLYAKTVLIDSTMDAVLRIKFDGTIYVKDLQQVSSF
jgi:hypothetical protein